MKVGRPDQDVAAPPPGESLAGKVVQAVRAPKAWRLPRLESRQWGMAAALAGLIALGPGLTLLGAHGLAAREQAQVARLEAELAPRMARRAQAEQAREMLAPVLGQATLVATLDALARALPADASLMRAERSADGALELDISTPDPDALRAGLRRSPGFAGLREVGQRRSDAAMIVLLRGEAG